MTIDDERWIAGLVGHTLAGRYVVTGVLGQGGIGAVLDARHAAVGRRVAIKVLRPELGRHERVVERFHREARAAAACAREGVVDVLDLDRDPACGPFLVMEHIEGETLAERLQREAPLSPRDAASVVLPILATLEAVHARGIVHRDLKPSNVMLARTPEGRAIVKIVDFGVAREVSAGGPVLTVPGAVLGTPGYMAPEQAAGSEDVDARADVFAVGAILYTCLAGRPPLGDLQGAAALRAVLLEAPRPLDQLRPDLPRALVDVVARAMAKSRLDRFPDASTLRGALTQAVAALAPGAAGGPSEPAAPDLLAVPQTARSPGATLGDAPTVLAARSEATWPATVEVPGGRPARPPGSRRILALVAALAAAVASAGAAAWWLLSPPAPPPVDVTGWQVVSHEGLTLRLPPGWTPVRSANPAVAAAWATQSRAGSTIPLNVALSIDRGAGSLDRYVEVGRDHQRAAGARELLLADADVGVPALRLESLFATTSPPYRETALVTVVEGDGHVLRCFNAPDDERGLAVCRAIVRSARAAPRPGR